jgi:hypothetical protein
MHIDVNLKIAHLNCKGYTSNRELVTDLSKWHDIVFLTETWVPEWKPEMIIDIKQTNMHIFTINNKLTISKKGRVPYSQAWLISNKIKHMTTFESVNKRITVIKLVLGKFNYAFIGVYLSCNNNRNQEYELDLELIASTHSRLVRQNFKPMILGDLNADTRRLKYANDRLLWNFSKRYEFVDLTKLFVQPMPNTFLSAIGKYSAIDGFLVCDYIDWREVVSANIIATRKEKKSLRKSGDKWKDKIKSIWDYKRNSGDHRPVSIELVIKVEKNSIKNFDKKRKLHWTNKAHRDTYAENVRFLAGLMKLDEIGSNMSESECGRTVAKLHTLLTQSYNRSVKAIYKKKPHITTKRKRWWTGLIGTLMKYKNTALRLWRASKKSRHKQIHKQLSRKIKSLIKKRKLYVKWLERKELIDAFTSNKQKFWNNIQVKRSSRVEIDIPLEELKRSYEENFNKITQSQASRDKEEKMAKVVQQYAKIVAKKSKKVKISPKRIREILLKLKNNKAPGHSKTTNEMFKYCADTMVPFVISKILENMLNNHYCPGELNIGVITTIIKDSKASCQEISNTRPITLSDPLSNVIEMLILENINKKGSIHKFQYGFRSKNSCMHAVFHLNEIAWDAKSKDKNAYALFLDFTKAFDKINRVKMLFCLISQCDPKYWLLIRNYYSKSTLIVRDANGKMSDPFKSTVGVKQGGPASPRKFNALINILIVLLSLTNKTYKLNKAAQGILVYADDTTIVCDSISNLNALIKIIEKFCDEYDVIINVKKTKTLRFGPKYKERDEDVILLNTVVEQVDSFKFLGVTVCSDLGYEQHIQIRKAMYMQAIAEINNLGFNDPKIPVKIKSLLYQSLARSKLLYGLEVAKLNANETKKLLSKIEGSVLKRANSLTTNCKTTPLAYAMDITPIALQIKKRKISFIIQLVRNQATNDIITSGTHKSLDDVIEYIGVEDRHKALGQKRYEGILLSACIAKLEAIKTIELKLKESPITTSVRYLLNNRNKENDETVKYLLDPRRGKRG